jgi:uncharacterized protein YndB with AHSA1/START domain
MKEKFELEFLFKTSPRVLENMISTPTGLAEWFADDVNANDDIYSFVWDGSVEEARLITHKMNTKIKFKWLADEEEGLDTYFEINYQVDSMTSMVALRIVDFSSAEDKEGAIMLWDQQINDLKRLLGA